MQHWMLCVAVVFLHIQQETKIYD